MKLSPKVYQPFSKRLVKLEPMFFVPMQSDNPSEVTVSKMLVSYDNYPLFYAYTGQDGAIWLCSIGNELIFQARTSNKRTWNINLYETESILLYVRLTLQFYQAERRAEPDHDAEATAGYVNQDR